MLYARTPWDGGLDERFTWVTVPGREPWWNFRTARRASRTCDVFLSSNSYLTAAALTIPGVPVVYDLITFDRRARPSRRSAVIERLTLGLAVRRAAALIAISQSTRDDLVRRFPTAAGRVDLGLLGVAPQLVATARDAVDHGAVAEPFVLAVGTIEPRKNLPRLVEAYRRLPAPLRASHRLVLAGRLGWQYDETIEAIESLGDRCVWLGCVSDEALADLYRRCAVLCFPSLSEGFGLPVVEAMCNGAPVLTSDRPALREVGGDAARYCEPTDPDSISAALRVLLHAPDGAAALGARGRRHAASFTWDRTAASVLTTLERVAAGRQAAGSVPASAHRPSR